jgi:histidinol-phosphatase
MLVAEGALEVAAEPELQLFDMAALDIVVREAGGRFTGVNGIDGSLQGNAISSNGLLHDEVIAALK